MEQEFSRSKIATAAFLAAQISLARAYLVIAETVSDSARRTRYTGHVRRVLTTLKSYDMHGLDALEGHELADAIVSIEARLRMLK